MSGQSAAARAADWQGRLRNPKTQRWLHWAFALVCAYLYASLNSASACCPEPWWKNRGMAVPGGLWCEAVRLDLAWLQSVACSRYGLRCLGGLALLYVPLGWGVGRSDERAVRLSRALGYALFGGSLVFGILSVLMSFVTLFSYGMGIFWILVAGPLTLATLVFSTCFLHGVGSEKSPWTRPRPPA